jgi:Fe-S-cluster containining protein
MTSTGTCSSDFSVVTVNGKVPRYTMPSPRLRLLDLPTAAQLAVTTRLRAAVGPRVYSSRPCSTCHAPCCQTATVEVTTVEALRLCFGMMLSLEAVVERLDCPPHADQQRLASVPIPLVDGLTVLRLRHRADKDGGGCTFLTTALEQRRCGAHALRPGACRLFPFHVDAGPQSIAVGDPAICPTAWLRTPELETAVLKDFRAWRRDLRLEHKLVARWVALGGAQKPWKDYSAYAVEFAQSQLGLRRPVWMTPGQPVTG